MAPSPTADLKIDAYIFGGVATLALLGDASRRSARSFEIRRKFDVVSCGIHARYILSPFARHFVQGFVVQR
jgi:hypothetical protein